MGKTAEIKQLNRRLRKLRKWAADADQKKRRKQAKQRLASIGKVKKQCCAKAKPCKHCPRYRLHEILTPLGCERPGKG